MPLAAIASLTARIAHRTLCPMNFSFLGNRRDPARSNGAISALAVHGNPAASNRRSGPMPDSPRRLRLQAASTERPRGTTSPMPVTATSKSLPIASPGSAARHAADRRDERSEQTWKNGPTLATAMPRAPAIPGSPSASITRSISMAAGAARRREVIQ